MIACVCDVDRVCKEDDSDKRCDACGRHGELTSAVALKRKRVASQENASLFENPWTPKSFAFWQIWVGIDVHRMH